MKLPLDHFRLLGVKPGVNSSEIEQALIERLKSPPSEGYSLETLDVRAELLRASGAFLMDEQRYQAHEQQLKTAQGDPDGGGFFGIDLEPDQEVVAPLLLLEAKESLQAFELALELLSQQGETAAFRGHQQADLLLMAALAARRASQQMWTQRLYDQSAQILERIIQVLSGHASQARRKAMLEDDLHKIAPFQILDLLNQESCTPMERQRGLRSLKALIDHRGGLDADDDERSPILFQDFFKQIRPALTINEQLELFEAYSGQEASTATFLLAYTRAAAGFQRRQPAHIDAALAAMEAMGDEGLEPEKACLLLLLGQPDVAQDMVQSCQDPRLSQWFASYPSTSDSLAGLCSYCSQWLEEQVLPCYRDVDPQDKVDLEAYFANPHVQDYINNKDSLPEHGSNGPSGEGKAKQTKELVLFTPVKSPKAPKHLPQSWQTGPQEPLLSPPPHRSSLADVAPPSTARPAARPAASPAARQGKTMESPPPSPQHQPLWPLLTKGGILVASIIVLLVLRPWSPRTATVTPPIPPSPQPPSSPPDAVAPTPPPPELPALANTPVPFSRPQIQAVQEAERLDLAGVTTLLGAWLHSKAEVLDTSSASQPSPSTLDALALLAVPEQVTAVLNQHQLLRERGEQLNVNTTLGDVSLLEQTPSQVSARVVLTYAESTRNADGATTATFGPTILSNDYTFTREEQGWRLLRFSPSPPLGVASR